MTLVSQIRLARATIYAFASMGVLWGAYAALIPDTKAMLAVGDAAFGSLLLATPIAAMSAMLMAPYLAPRFGHAVLPLSVIALACAFLLPGWMHQPILFAAAMVLVGGANGFLDVTMTARVSGLETDRGLHLMNLNHAAYSFGYAASAILTGVARNAGWAPGEVLGLAGLLIVLFSPVAFERGVGAAGFGAAATSRPRFSKLALWGGLIVMIAFMAENASENWSALHIERSLGGSKHEGSFGPAVLALTMGIGRLSGQMLIAHLSERRLIIGGTVVAAFGTAAVGLAPSVLLAYVGLVVAGVGISVLAPTCFAVVGRLSSPDQRNHVIARTTALGYFGYFIGPPSLGFLSQALGLRYALVAMAGTILLTLYLFPKLMALGLVKPGGVSGRGN